MEHTKSFNTQGGKNRLRFASAKSRAKSASADVYRSSDRRLTSSATAVREKRVHNGGVAGASAASPGGANKRRKKGKVEFGNNNSNRGGEGGEDEVRYFGRDNDAEGLDMGRTAVIVSSKSKLRLDDANVNLDAVDGDYEDDDEEEEERDKTLLLTGGTIFRTELEVAAQRNGSQLFQKLTHELRQSCKSLAELLHHAEKIVELLCAYLLSPRGNGMGFHSPVRGASEDLKAFKKRMSEKAPNGFVVNVATNDVLHLFGVLARELRQEIYPFLHSRILPRIIDDMLNPPTTTAVTVSISSSGGTQQEQDTHQNVPLDVSHIESALRALSYLFKYNSDQLIYNHPTDSPSKTKLNGEGKQAVGDADILRQYYGKTICHKRDIVRRLACESYAPLLRKCLDKGLKRHLSRTIKALASSIAAATMTLEEGNVEEEGAMEVDNENDGAIHMTNSMRKAREDAIDGVSSLLFEVSRGAPGRVHSKKGRLVVRAVMDCLTSFCNGASGGSKHGKNDDKENGHRLLVEKNKADAVYEVASQFMFKLRGHVIRGTREEIIVVTSSFVDVLDEFHRALNSTTSMMKEASSTIVAHVLGIVVDLISETITFQDGRLVHDGQIHRGEGEADRIAVSLQALLSNDIYSKSGVKLQNQILQYLCSAWRANPSHPSFATRLGKFFPSIVSPKKPEPSASSTEEASFLDPALVLAQNLLLHLPKKVASTSLIPALLSAAASPIGKDGNADASLVLLHTISTAVWPNDDLDADIDDSEADSLFTWEAAELCPGILPKVRSALFDICLSDDMKNLSLIEKKKSSPRSSSTGLSAAEQLARVGFASRCIPFLVCLECADNSDEDSEDDNASVENEQYEEVLNRVFKWFASTLKHIDAILMNQTGTIVEQINVYVAQSLLLESFSKCAVECYNRLSSSSIASSLKKTMSKAKSYASSLLVLQPKSIWVVKGVAAVVKSLGIIDPGTKLNDRSNEMFELLAPNLAQSNHFLRLNTLEILASYPARPFVTDHADLDLTDDLDEEPSQRPQPVEEEAQTNEDNSAATSLSGSCDIMSLLRVIESTPITMPNQRKLTSQLGRVEVYARTGKLPIVYAEATALHMLGLLHVKFAPVWPAAVQVIVALSSAQEGPTWPCIEAALKESMERPSPGATLRTKAKELDAKKKTDQRNKSRHIETIAKHHALCVSWETSKGKNHDIFHSHDGERNGQVSRHVEADDLTRFESIWSIMENAPHLTSTKSKMIVPIFFEFMLAQFYVFHSDDPDAREICLTENMDEFR